MPTKLIAMVCLPVVTLWASHLPADSKADKKAAPAKYTVKVEGTRGVKLRMLLIKKPSATSGLKRESKLVTVPFQTSFEAKSFYVWFETLDGGESGNDGDRITGSYERNAEPQGGGFGATIKKQNKQSFSFGNL